MAQLFSVISKDTAKTDMCKSVKIDNGYWAADKYNKCHVGMDIIFYYGKHANDSGNLSHVFCAGKITAVIKHGTHAHDILLQATNWDLTRANERGTPSNQRKNLGYKIRDIVVFDLIDPEPYQILYPDYESLFKKLCSKPGATRLPNCDLVK